MVNASSHTIISPPTNLGSFACFPLEIREEIYKAYLHDEIRDHGAHLVRFSIHTMSRKTTIGLLGVNRDIKLEVISVLDKVIVETAFALTHPFLRIGRKDQRVTTSQDAINDFWFGRNALSPPPAGKLAAFYMTPKHNIVHGCATVYPNNAIRHPNLLKHIRRLNLEISALPHDCADLLPIPQGPMFTAMLQEDDSEGTYDFTNIVASLMHLKTLQISVERLRYGFGGFGYSGNWMRTGRILLTLLLPPFLAISSLRRLELLPLRLPLCQHARLEETVKSNDTFIEILRDALVRDTALWVRQADVLTPREWGTMAMVVFEKAS